MNSSKFLSVSRKLYDLIKEDYPDLLKITDEIENTTEFPVFEDINNIKLISNPEENWGQIEISYNYKGQQFCNKTTIVKLNKVQRI